MSHEIPTEGQIGVDASGLDAEFYQKDLALDQLTEIEESIYRSELASRHGIVITPEVNDHIRKRVLQRQLQRKTAEGEE